MTDRPPLIRMPVSDQPIDACITCGDQAVEVVVVEMMADAMARVDTGTGTETVSVALVHAALGDRLLVHAGEAIARLEPDP
jgi:hydrogenase expression/formation protein HypC